MRKTRMAVVLSVAAIITAAVGFNTRSRTAGMGPTARPILRGAAGAQGPVHRPVPAHLPYEFLFRRIQFFVDKKMPDHQLSALLQKELGINAGRAKRLKQIALSCMEEVRQQDARAQQTIEQIKARYPNGIIKRGQEPPPPVTPELALMQQERNAMFLRARSSLQTFLGEREFRLVDEKVKSKADNSLPIRPVAQ